MKEESECQGYFVEMQRVATIARHVENLWDKKHRRYEAGVFDSELTSVL